jgi:hypothetical protein
MQKPAALATGCNYLSITLKLEFAGPNDINDAPTAMAGMRRGTHCSSLGAQLLS